MARGSIKMYNVVMHAISFMMIFTAAQTSGNVITAALNNIERNGKHIFNNKGYISLTIIYVVYALANFIAPSIVALFGPRATMFAGGICNAVLIGSIIYPYVFTLYIASVVAGVGSGLIWTAQGNFLTINSDKETMGRNSGIFWAILQCSLLFGNMFVYFYFKGEYIITDHSRQVLYTVLFVSAVIGTLTFLFLRKTPTENAKVSSEEDQALLECSDTHNSIQQHQVTPYDAFKKTLHLLTTPNMLLLSVTIAYTGFEITFFSGIYGNSIGNIDKSKLHDPKRQIGLIGMFIGIGEITGGLLFGIFGKHTNKYGRSPIVLLGFIVHLITYFLIFMNVPDQAPLKPTDGPSWFNYNLYVYVFSAFLLGFGNSSYNTQIYSILGASYSEDSAPAFALFKFVQSVTAAIAFGYANVLTLRYQLFILVISAVAGTITFFVVERKSRLEPEIV